MKKLFILFLLCQFLIGCSILPFEATVKEDHFRFENFKRDKGPKMEFVHLMCFKKQPVAWQEPKQYEGGEHTLWVKAHVKRRNVPNSTKEAFAKFDVNLAPGKSYMLNRKTLENDKISMWIQEVETGKQVSDVKTKELTVPKLVEYRLRKEQCESGTI